MTSPSAIALPSAVPLYPRSVTPARRPIPLHRFIVQFVRNPLRIIPEEAYREPMVVRQPRGRSGRKVAWFCDPKLVDEILAGGAAEFQKSELEKRVLGGSFGDGILTSDGARWKWQRRTMAPLFRATEIQSYVPAMALAATQQVKRWQRRGSGSMPVDRDMTDTTFSIIARTMLGGESRETGIIKTATELYLSRISWEVAYTVLGLPEWAPHPGSLRMYRAVRRLRGAMQKLIRRRLTEGGQPEGAAHDLLGRLLAARDPETSEPMSEPQLIDNLLTLLGAGHETTAKALTWTLYLLARAPEWQDSVRAEVRDTAPDRMLEAADIPRLRITQQVVKEAMRLYPPAPSMARVFVKPAVAGGESFAAGDLAIVPIYCIHRHRLLWDDPNRFDPSRFAPELEKSYPRTQYMPFGAGPRVCIGNAFAMAEATIILATLVKAAAFEWEGHDEPEPISRVTLRPSGGLSLRVTLLPDAQPREGSDR